MTPADAFLVALQQLEDGQPLDTDLAQWMAAGFRAFAQGKARTLEQALQIDGGSGGAHFRLNKAIPQAQLATLLEALEKALAAHFGGTRNALARLIAAGLSDAEACEDWPADALRIVHEITTQHPNCPKSGKQIVRILKGETCAKRMDINAGLYVPVSGIATLPPATKQTNPLPGVSTMNLPNKQARKHCVFECLRDAGMVEEKARSASLLVPDCVLVHALAHGKPFHVLVVDDYSLFMKCGDHDPVILGHLLPESGYVRAFNFWCELDFTNMTAEEAAQFDFDCVLGDIDRTNWQHDYARLANPDSVLTVDVARTLREFRHD